MKSIITVSNVSVSYDKKNQAVHDVSFYIKENEFFGLVGESGCGKSTLGNATLGLVPFEGSIKIDETSYSKKNKKEFARLVQAVFQNPQAALNPKKTIGFTMEEPLKIHNIGTKQERVLRVKQMLELVGLNSSYYNRYPQELSGGQKQRVCIGSALMLNPKLIIADEAISALDASIGSQILNLFREIHSKMSLSLLFISHNLNVVHYLCSRIAVMYRGRIVELASADEIFFNAKHPYTKLLLSAVPKLDSKETTTQHLELLKPDIKDACCFYHRCPFANELCKTEPQLKLLDKTKDKEQHFVSCFYANKI